MSRRRRNEGGDKYKIIDVDGSKIQIDDLLERYFFNENYHTSCAVILTRFHNNTIEQYSTLKDKPSKDEDEDKEEEEKRVNHLTIQQIRLTIQ